MKTIVYVVAFVESGAYDQQFSNYSDAVTYATRQAGCSVGHPKDIADGGRETIIRIADGQVLGRIIIHVIDVRTVETLEFTPMSRREISPLASTLNKSR